jgi:hypothetical protein
VNQSAQTKGRNALNQEPSIFDLSKAPNHNIGFYAAWYTDPATGVPHFYATAVGAQ